MANFLQVGIQLEDKFTKGINGAIQSFARFKQSITSQAGALSGAISKPLNALFAPIRALAQAATSVRGILAAFGAHKLGEFAGQIEDLDRSFANLAKSIGSTADEALAKLRVATKGTVSDFNLMLTANRAILLGAAETDEELVLLAETARRLGRAMGRDVNDAFNDLALGIARQSRLILDNLGIIVNVEEANKDYAATLGKTADELSEVERRQAFMNAVMEGANRRVAALGGDVQTLSDSYSRFRATLANVAQDVIRGFTPLLTDVFERLSKWFTENQDTVFNFFIELAEVADRMMPQVIRWVEQLGKAIARVIRPLSGLARFTLRGERAELQGLRSQEIYRAADELGINRHTRSPALSFLGDFSADPPEDVLARIKSRSREQGSIYGDVGRLEAELSKRYSDVNLQNDATTRQMEEELVRAEQALVLNERRREAFLRQIEDFDRKLAENQEELDFFATGTVPVGTLGPQQGIFGDVSSTLRDLQERRRAQREAEAYSAADKRRQEALAFFASGPPVPEIGVPPEPSAAPQFAPLPEQPSAFQKGIDAAVVGLERLKKQGLDTFSQIANAVVAVGDSLADNFTAGVLAAVEGTQTLRQAFRGMAKGILQDITKILVRMAAIRLIGAGASALSSLSGPREIDSSLTDEQYAALGPRTGDYSTDPGVNNKFLFDEGYDHGGIATEPSIFAERRPEAAVPLIPGTRKIPVELMGARSGTTVYNIYNVQATDVDSFNRLFIRGAADNKAFLANLHLRQYQDNPRLQAGYT